jgi:hypothetical protein
MNNLTFTIVIIGIISTLMYSFKDSIFNIFKLKNMPNNHDLKQHIIKEDIIKTQETINQKEIKIKELEEKQEQSKQIIKEIISQNNEEVKKILKEEKISNLLKEFDKW